jgi:hypothetical protein
MIALTVATAWVLGFGYRYNTWGSALLEVILIVTAIKTSHAEIESWAVLITGLVTR